MGLLTRVGALLSAFVVGCGMMQTHVSIENQATSPVTDARLTAAGQEIWSGTLQAGETKAIQFSPAGDGSFEFSGTLNGTPLTSELVGYTTPNDPTRHALLIDAQGKVSYSTGQ